MNGFETCEIVYSLDKTGMFDHVLQFYAEADGTHGRFRVAESPKFRGSIDPNDQYAIEALNRLIGKLEQDGWEAAGRGIEWYRFRFRRKVG